MKKILAFVLLITLFTLFSFSAAFAQNASYAISKDAKEYILPYPGMLPDNPFYKLKILRDKIALFLISNPNKKIDYYLLLSDKGIVATSMLINKNKIALAKETALKAEHNYTLLAYVIKADKWNVSKEQYGKAETAALKHQEILKEIIKKVPKNDKKMFETVLYFSELNLKEIKKTLKSSSR